MALASPRSSGTAPRGCALVDRWRFADEMWALRPAPEGSSGRDRHPVDGQEMTRDSVGVGPSEARGGLHPLSPVATRGTQRVLQPVYLALRFLTLIGVKKPTGIQLISVSSDARLGPTVESDGSVKVVHDRRRNMAVPTAVLIRFAHPLGVRRFTPSRNGRMNLRERQADQESIALETPAAERRERASGDPGPRGCGAEASSGKIVPSRREELAETDLRSEFQPLSSLPENVPPRWRSHWLKLARQAAASYRAAVELKCLDCCAWERTEARRCEIRGCPLWAASGRIFRRVRGAAERWPEGGS